MTIDNKINSQEQYSFKEEDTQSALDMMLSVLKDPDSEHYKDLEPNVIEAWNMPEADELTRTAQAVIAHFKNIGEFTHIVNDLEAYLNNRNAIQAEPIEKKEEVKEDVSLITEEEEKSTEPIIEEKKEEVKEEIAENKTEKKDSGNITSVETPFGTIKRGTITLADKELHDGLTEALMQRNKIIAPEATYEVASLYSFTNDKGEFVTNVDIKLPVREGVRDKEEVVKISKKELNQEMLPQTIMVDGMAVSKHMELPKRLRNTINRATRGKKTWSKSWTVTDIVRAHKGDDILFTLQNEHGETHHINPTDLEQFTVEDRINKTPQRPILGKNRARDLEEFLNSKFKFPKGTPTLTGDFSFENAHEFAAKAKQAFEGTVPSEESETTPFAALEENNASETEVKPETTIEDLAEEIKAPTEENSDSAIIMPDKEDTEVAEETPESAPEQEVSGELKETISNGIIKGYIEKVFNVPNATVEVRSTESTGILIDINYSKKDSDSNMAVRELITLPNSDEPLVVKPENILVTVNEKEKGGMLGLIGLGKKTTETEGARVEQEKAGLAQGLTELFQDILKKQPGLDPEKHEMKITNGQLAIYSK